MKKFYFILTGIIVIVAINVIIYTFVESVLSGNKYDFTTEYYKELELKFSGTKSDLVDEVQNYIDSIAPYSNLRAFELVENCEKYNVDIKFVLAQGEVESHFGTKGMASKTNSVWNVGAFDGYDLKHIKTKYNNPNQSIEPYLILLNKKYLTNKIELDLLDKYESIDGYRYATDKFYEEKLKNKYNYILNKTKIDSLQNKLKYYKDRLGK